MAKIKTLTPDAVLKSQGIDVSKIDQSKTRKKEINLLAERFVNFSNIIDNTTLIQQTSKALWIEYLTDLDIRQWCNVLIWENTPNQIASWLINQMSYYYGSLAAFDYNSKFYILPWIQNGKINAYGLPNSITPITYNGTNDGINNIFSKSFKAIIDNSGNYDPKANTIIYYPTLPRWNQGNVISTYIKNRKVIDQMADILARINIQIVVTNKKIFIKCDDVKSASNLLKQLNQALSSNSPFAVIGDMTTEVVELQPKETNASDLWLHLKGFNDLRNMTNGVANDGFFDKKERKLNAETEGAFQQTTLTLQDRLSLAELFVKQCKLQFKGKIDGIEKFNVRVDESLLPKESNGEQDNGNYDEL